MKDWDVNTALNHHAGCSIYDDGACTCGLRARTERLERSPLAPGEGTWSVFAEKMLKERDEAREEVSRLRSLQAELVAALEWYVKEDDTIESMESNKPWLKGKRRAQALIAKVKGTSDPIHE